MTKKQGLVFFGIIAAGAGASITMLNKWGTPVEEDPPPQPPPADTDPAAPEPEPDSDPPKPEPPKPEPPEASAKYDSADALVNALMDRIRDRDFEGLLEIAGPEAVDPNVRPELESLLSSPDFAPDPDNPVSELAKTADSIRWSINLVRQNKPDDPKPPPEREEGGDQCQGEDSLLADSEDFCQGEETKPPPPEKREIYIDITRDPEKGFQVKKISLPLHFTGKGPGGVGPGGAMVKGPGSNAPGAPAAGGGSKPGKPGTGPGIGVPGADALTVAHAFSKAIEDRNFEIARQLTDTERVTDERVAALMIAMEEGDFRLQAERPLVVTLSRDDLTWVLTRIASNSASSEFALEMSKNPEAGWLVDGLTFSKLLATLAQSAGAGGVAYAPIVADPQGGDSLVLYFEFDDEKVSTRTARQLKIVAGILQKDASRKIHINGHADALGTDDYNENLSNNRAASVRKALIDYGVASDQIVTKSFGEAMPRRPNFNPDGTDNPGGRSQNRRAEVYLDF